MDSVNLTYLALADKRASVLRRIWEGLVLLMVTTGLCQGDWNSRGEISQREREWAVEPYDSGVRASHNDGAASSSPQDRLLYSFERGRDGETLLSRSCSGLKLLATMDYGVTRGSKCVRVVPTRLGSYAEFQFSKAAAAGWGGFDYLAIDVHMERTQPLAVHLEVRDKRSKDYFTRCTLAQHIRKGSHTLYWPIAELRRNGKEGLDATQLRADDLIRHADFTHVKLFFETPAEGEVEFWMDSVRLIKRQSLFPAMPLELPQATVVALDVGMSDLVQAGFSAPAIAGGPFSSGAGGVTASTDVVLGGSGWPDPLSGTFALAADSGVLRLRQPVPNGDYRAIILAGPHIQSAPRHRRYLLKVNGATLYDDLPDQNRIDSVAYLHRFMWTAYSERSDGLFLDYVERMYPVYSVDVAVSKGVFEVAAKNFLVSGAILIPRSHVRDAERLVARLRVARAKALRDQTEWPFKRGASTHMSARGDSPLGVFVPASDKRPHPKLRPSGPAKSTTRIVLTAAPGQNVFARIALRPESDLGWGEVRLSRADDGGAVIPKNAWKLYMSNYRYNGQHVSEGALLPTGRVYFEGRVTQVAHLWGRLPRDLMEGRYPYNVDVFVGGDRVRRIPMAIDVLPLIMPRDIPAAFGFYYKGRVHPELAGEHGFRHSRDVFTTMRALGMTSVTIPTLARVVGINEKEGTTTLSFNDTTFRAALDAGLGNAPSRPLLLEQLSISRGIAARLSGLSGDMVDRNPGVELTHGSFAALWADAMTQYRRKLAYYSGHVAFEVIDEPRSHPNPWNRNLADTKTYASRMGTLGLTRFVTLMGDAAGGEDYTELVDVVDVVSTHMNTHTRKIRAKTLKQGRRLWLFNGGMSRESWGVSSWGMGATGRFEWHWCWPGDVAHNQGGYPGMDWHNPFTRLHGLAPNAPMAEAQPGFLLTSALFDAAEGITDYSYLYELERLLASAVDNDSEWARAGRLLLGDIRAKVRAGKPPPDDWRSAVMKSIQALQKDR